MAVSPQSHFKIVMLSVCITVSFLAHTFAMVLPPNAGQTAMMDDSWEMTTWDHHMNWSMDHTEGPLNNATTAARSSSKIAGVSTPIVVGVIAGVILVGALAAFFVCRSRRLKEQENLAKMRASQTTVATTSSAGSAVSGASGNSGTSGGSAKK